MTTYSYDEIKKIADFAMYLDLPSFSANITNWYNSLTPSQKAKLGSNYIIGISGDDYIEGTTSKDVIIGNGGDDYLGGGNGDDILIGGDGYDVLAGGKGSDFMLGGKGDDFYEADNNDDRIIEYFDEGIDSVYATVSYRLPDNVENLYFSEETKKSFTGIGNELDNIICGNAGNNTLFGLDGNDSIYGFAGNDTLAGGEGIDFIYGDEGNDMLWGGSDDDELYGGIGNDMLAGGSGNDRIYGEDGNDVLYAEAGDDYLEGGAGNDSLFGGSGTNTFNSGAGNDSMLSASSTDDNYIFASGDGKDRIIDFGGNDTVCFESGISSSDIAFYKASGSHGKLLIDYGVNSGSDQITIENWKNPLFQTETFTLGSGKYLTNDDINKLLQDMDAYAAENGISLSSVADVKSNTELMNMISSAWHD